MSGDILDRIGADLLSIPPLIFRGIRRKLLKMALVDIDVDISPLHFEIMKLLAEAGKLHVTEIGERLQIARAEMTHLIDKLVNLGIVERQADPSDRRIINVVLTEKGKTIAEKHEGKIRMAVRETLSALSDEELGDLSDSLRKLRNILSKLQ